MKKYQKIISFALAVLLLPALLSGCGKKEDTFQVIFAAPFVAASFGQTLSLDSEGAIQFSGFSFGSDDVDPMAYAAGAMTMTAMLTAGEVDVLVCDLENAARYAQGGYFLDLTEVFPEEDLTAWSESLLTFDVVDEYGVPTGEKTAPCGLRLSGREDLTYILAEDTCGLFLSASTGDLEKAKEVFRAILGE